MTPRRARLLVAQLKALASDSGATESEARSAGARAEEIEAKWLAPVEPAAPYRRQTTYERSEFTQSPVTGPYWCIKCNKGRVGGKCSVCLRPTEYIGVLV